MLFSARVNFAIYVLCLLAPWALLWLDERLLFPYETGKGWAFRVIVELAFSLLIYQQFVVSRFSMFENKWARVMTGLLVMFLAWSLLTAITGIDAYRSINSNYERMAGWIAYLHWAMYLLCLLAVLNQARTKLIMGNLIMVVVIVCLIGLFETDKRIISTLGNPIYLGNLAVLGLFLLAFWLAERLQEESQGKIIIIELALAIVLVMGLALIKSASRGPFLALACGLLATGLVVLTKISENFKSRTKIIVLSGIIMLISGVVMYFGTLQVLFKQSDHYALQRIGHISLQDQTTADRLENWRIALDAASQHPLLGWGQENYAIAFTEHYRAGVMDNADIWFDRAHNAYLDVLIAAGIPGLVLYCLILSLALVLVLRVGHWSVSQKAFAVGFLVAFMIKNLVGLDTFSSTLLWVSVVAIILSQFQSSVPTSSFVMASNLKGWLFVPVLALALACVYWLNIKPYQANRHLARGMDEPALLGQKAFNPWLERSQATQRIGVNAQLAVYDKLLIQPHVNALTEQAASNHVWLFQQTGELISGELERQSRNYRIKYNGSLLLARLGHYDLTINLLQELTRSAPQRTVFWHSLAQVHAAAGDETSAAKVRTIITQLNPNWRP